MSSPRAQVSAPLLECEGRLIEAEVVGRSKATGVVWRKGDERGGCHLGEFQWMDISGGLESREQNRSYRGHGLRMLSRGEATFDRSGGCRLQDTEYTYTLKYTHVNTENLSARFIAHLEARVFFLGEKCCGFHIVSSLGVRDTDYNIILNTQRA